jgi:tRNA (cytosine38-C5)-methyltransferase
MLRRTLNQRLLLCFLIFLVKTSSTRQILLSTLQSLQYTTLELLITPLQFGIPNSRLRYYLLAKLSPLVFSGVPAYYFHTTDVLRHIPGHNSWVDPRMHAGAHEYEILLSEESIHEIKYYLDEEPEGTESHPHAVPEKVLRKWGRLFDIVLPSSRRTCCFTRGF